MIIIDGQKSDLSVKNFDNLEDLLVKVLEDEQMNERVVTDVLVNDEAFSEIYPHQAEDVAAEEIEKVEIKTVPISEMAVNITRELYKVINLMSKGARQVADLFRQADDMEALDIYQDLLEVTRDFLGMIGILRSEFRLENIPLLENSLNKLSELFSEMVEVQENEDWILLSDLLEYEFLPLVEEWKKIVAYIREEIKEITKA
ncbi:hypothetical protein [Desulfovulcanus sp.]